ncbi:PAS domain S-box protein [Flammeovirgaceae bacterium SG7u.111]|nr:PAS domain S-box protein [Flammeovirgaceae bacterium SG7u.132]WPO33254.1 PAS domain S-box protein [Flammeovirgaceae bacterium SG7u.111]
MIKISKFFSAPADLKKVQDSLKGLKEDISSATLFVKKIEDGELDTPYPNVDEDKASADTLSGALINMRNQLKVLNKTEEERKWITEGLALFGDVLRKNQQDLDETCSQVISNLVKYVNANQGAIYIANEGEKVLDQKACYAYGRKKHHQKQILFGEGLVGQVFLEKETMLLLDVPNDYINITSGLGHAAPKAIVLVPLKINDDVSGILELASFKNFESYQIDFLEKLGESIASVVSTIQTNEKTHHLLEESQQQSEALKAQEEELRQNMEELSATQEGIQRAMKEVQDKEIFMNTVINSTPDVVFVIDHEYKFKMFNTAFYDLWKGHKSGLKLGDSLLEFYNSSTVDHHKKIWDRALSGEFIALKEKVVVEGRDYFMHVTYSPLKNTEGEITSIAVFSKDLTEQELLIKKNEALLKDSQEQAEQMKAQEEELRQNMEEMAATQEEVQRQSQGIESRLHAINNSGIATIEFDLSGNIINANEIFLTLMGYSLEEIRGKHHSIFVSENYAKSEEYQTFWNDLKTGKAKTGEHERIKKDGSPAFLHGSYSAIKDAKGCIVSVLKLAVDITVSKIAQQELEEQFYQIEAQGEMLSDTLKAFNAKEEDLNNKLTATAMQNQELDARLVVLNAISIISESDEKGIITYVNEKFCEASQYTAEELLGQPHSIVRHPDTPNSFFKGFWETIQSGNDFRGYLKNRKKDGSAYYVDIMVSPVLDDDGNPIKYISSKYVIENTELAEQLLAKQEGELKNIAK